MWQVVGEGTTTAIYETEIGTLSYEEAKAAAIQQIDAFLQPALLRLEEIKADIDWPRGKKPALKAWESQYHPQQLVVARTKKNAIILTGCSRLSFESLFTQVDGWWWYPFAQKESVWQGDKGDYTAQGLKRIWPSDDDPAKSSESQSTPGSRFVTVAPPAGASDPNRIEQMRLLRSKMSDVDIASITLLRRLAENPSMMQAIAEFDGSVAGDLEELVRQRSRLQQEWLMALQGKD